MGRNIGTELFEARLALSTLIELRSIILLLAKILLDVRYLIKLLELQLNNNYLNLFRCDALIS